MLLELRLQKGRECCVVRVETAECCVVRVETAECCVVRAMNVRIVF